jgi:transposase
MQLQLYGKKIWIYHKPIDFRRSINGLSSFIANDIQQNPQAGIFLFYNKGKDKIKCLSWHKTGWLLIYKRLEKNRFYFELNQDKGVSEMSVEEVGWLLAGLEWQKMRHWKELSYDKFN